MKDQTMKQTQDRIAWLEEEVIKLRQEMDKILNRKKRDKNNYGDVGAYFRTVWKKKYGRDYKPWGPKENSQVKQWASGFGAKEEACSLINYYFRWKDPWIVKRSHQLCWLVTRTPELIAQIDNHNKINRAKDLRLGQIENESVKGEANREAYIESRSTRNQERISGTSSGEVQNASDGKLLGHSNGLLE
jgi:hypothetical protein